MPNCRSCSAPLPADSSFCSYCGTRNDLDVMAMQRFSEEHEESRRLCPDCEVVMETIHLSEDGSFAVERCQACYGLFFDPGEVQAFLEATVAPAFVVNYQEIVNINHERANRDRPVHYVKCPDCGKYMNRVNFGATSGVVMDQCKAHGVWLSNGELIHLMEWKRAGGQLLADQRQKARQEELAARAEQVHPSLPIGFEEPASPHPLNLLFDSAVNLITRLFG